MSVPFRHDETGTPAVAWRTHPARAGVPRLRLDVDGQPCERVVVVAAHPDDESLGAGGLLASAAASGLAVDLVILTAGEASHPQSPTHDPRRLADVRRQEAVAAAAHLTSGLVPQWGDLSDGGVADREEDALGLLVDLLGDARSTILVAPWRHDGHPDHEAAGRAAAAAAARTGARLLEYPIWFWHWGRPDDAPWSDLVVNPLAPDALARKHAAMGAHRSQVAPLSDRAGDEVLLGAELLEHFAGDAELFVAQPPADPALNDLQTEDADPWRVEHRWYERRKRDLTLAVLPRPRFDRVLEVGCSRGALAEALSPRCEELLAVDSSPAAVRSARERDYPGQVELAVMDLPGEWPDGTFDLVVVSEVGYFLSPLALDQLVERVRGCLRPDGVVALCHWRHRIEGWVLDGPGVHARFLAAGVRPLLARYADDDVELLVLGADELKADPGE